MFRYLFDDLSLFDQETFADSTGDSDIRVGVNSGSLEKDLLAKYGGVTAEALVESALKEVAVVEELGYDNLAISSWAATHIKTRSEERRVGKECRMPCRSRWSPYH